MALNNLLILILCGTLFVAVASLSPIHSIFGQMNALLPKPSEEKRQSFPTIKGPKSKHEKIAIVGAGPSGLHMAYQLLKRGYTNITIFEANSFIGGKSHSEESSGGKVQHDMGTCYTNGDYTSLFQLIQELNIKVTTVPVPMATINYDGKPPLPYSIFLGGYFRTIWPNKSPSESFFAFFQTMLRYMQKHQELFGRYNGEIMPKPSEEIMTTQLNKTFDQFLVDNEMIVLRPVFKAAQTVMGYGQLDEVSTIYGLMWMTPQFVLDVASRSLNIDNKMYMYVEGFQYIWEQVAEHLGRNGVEIIKNAAVNKIRVRRNGNFKINYGNKCWMGLCQTERFDFLIWTPSIELANYVIHKFWKHFGLFFRTSYTIESQYLTTTLVSVHNETWSKINYWFSNIEGDRLKDTVWADRDSASVKNINLGSDFKGRTIVSYVFGPERHKPEDIKENLKQFYSEYNPVLKSEPHIWSYFPHYNVEDMTDGILWDLFSEQGKNNAWFIGSSVCFESVKSVMEYNHLILRHFN